MNILNGKELLKIMWVGDDTSALFRLADNSEVSRDAEIYQFIQSKTGLEAWAKSFGDLYRQWLHEDSSEIYDLRSPMLANLLQRIHAINQTAGLAYHVFYWYDVDRSACQDFKWERSPLSREPLIDLGPDYPATNRLISLRDGLVLPVEGRFGKDLQHLAALTV